MKVELRIYGSNPANPEFDYISCDVPAFWPVPRSNEYITLNLSDHPDVPEGEIDITLLKVITVNYELDAKFAVSKLVITTERS